MSHDSPEQLVDAFKAAALSVTKLYKTSAAAQGKARLDGYQDCLDELLQFLDRENIGLDDGEGWKIRRWATERLNGRDSGSLGDTDDEADKAETASSPEIHRSTSASNLTSSRAEQHARNDSAPPTIQAVQAVQAVAEQPGFTVPTQDSFTFQSQYPYPNIGNLDLSDSGSLNNTSPHTSSKARMRHNGNVLRNGSRPSAHIGKGAGQKRKINLSEIFDLGSLGYGKDMFGGGGGGGTGGGKRAKHT